MAEDVYSFVYDGEGGRQAFPGTPPRNLILALLAHLTPKPEWEGCTVFEGDSPEGGQTVCIATRGPCADEVQRHLVERLEGHGIPVSKVYEGGPEETARYATVTDGQWK
mgnify:CR=1 FL=1